MSASAEQLSLLAVAAAALVLAALERRWPASPDHPLLREGFVTDLVGYAILQSWACGAIIGRLTAGLDRLTGLSRLHLVSPWPAWAQLAFFLVEHDLYIYLFHRWQHRNRWLWRIHEAHHSVRQVDWLAGARSHTLEILVNQTVEFAPMVLLGASPGVLVTKAAVDGIWGMWIHANVGVRTGWLQKIVNGPEMHRWHHAAGSRGAQANFGTKLAIWDWLFGTAYLPRGAPLRFGLARRFPAGWVAQHLHAFRPFQRRPRAAAVAAEPPA